MKLGFLEPLIITLLLVLIPIYLLLNRSYLKKTQISKIFNQNFKYSKLKIIWIPLIILSILTFSLSRPYWGYQNVEVSKQGSELIVLLDVSTSMLAEDVSPNRLTVAKRKLLRIAELSQTDSLEWRIGVILFAGTAYQYVPLTSDLEIIKSFAEKISSELVEAEGSNLESALQLAHNAFKASNSLNKNVLIISDGEDEYFNSTNLSQLINENTIKVAILGMGSVAGSPIKLPNGTYIKDELDQIVISKLNESGFVELSKKTNGVYQNLALGDQDLTLIFDFYKSFLGSELIGTKTKIRNYNEIGSFLNLLLLILLLAYAILNRLNYLLLSILLLPKILIASPSEAYQAYQNKEFEKAKQLYEEAYDQNPEDKKVIQGLASSLYQLGNYKQAAKFFSELKNHSKTGKEYFESLYNLGNAELKSRNPKAAIESYEKALKIKPKDKQTEHNLEIAKQLLEEQQQQSSSQESSENSSSSSSSSSEQSSSEQSSSDSSQSEDSSSSGDSSESSKEGQSSSQSGGDSESSSSSSTGQGESEQPKEELSKQAARAWLDSLPDSPIGIKKDAQVGKRYGKQAW